MIARIPTSLRRSARISVTLATLALSGLGAFGCASHDRLLEDDVKVTEEEVLAAGSAKSPDVTNHLHHILDHRGDYDTSIVVAALVAIGERRDTSSIQPISRLGSDENEEIRWHCVLALKAIGGPEATAALERFADDKSVLVRDEVAARN